jgi:DNA recombination protein Rad52
MGFSDTQMRQLRAKLDGKHVKSRRANGSTLHYVEGWHVLSEANRIFGFDAWDRRTLSTRCVWTGMREKQYATAYTAKVRIRVRAGDIVIVREGSGTGEGRGWTPGEAHEIGLKSAETDATKRALATFGNSFGLALYDREQSGVRPRPNTTPDEVAKGPWALRADDGKPLATYDKPKDLVEGLRRKMSSAPNIERLFAVWEQNLATVRILNHRLKQQGQDTSDVAQGLVGHLKACAVALVPETAPAAAGEPNGRGIAPEARVKVDKSKLALAEVKRVRSKEHLKYVAQQPCVICGRQPSHAHHVRFAQPKGVGLKVSDEFTVPLCAIHHQQNHSAGNERQWWQDRKLDPLMVARKLWEESQDTEQTGERSA